MRSNLDHELLRKAVLRYLAMHHPAGFSASSLRNILLNRGLIDFVPEMQELNSALAVLEELELAKRVVSPIGSSEYWSATAKGRLEVERDGDQ